LYQNKDSFGLDHCNSWPSSCCAARCVRHRPISRTDKCWLL